MERQGEREGREEGKRGLPGIQDLKFHLENHRLKWCVVRARLLRSCSSYPIVLVHP